ncbi:MAG: OmpA family protein [Pseudomonadota bacterium]
MRILSAKTAIAASAAMCLAMALAMMCLARTAQAEWASRVEGGVFAGAQIFSDGPATITPESSLACGLRVGYLLNPWITLEGELGIVPTQILETDTGVFALGLRGHALLHPLTRGQFLPFLTLGIGSTTSWRTDPSTENQVLSIPLHSGDSDAVLDAGIGMKFSPFWNLWLRLDARALFAPGETDGIPTASYEIVLGAYRRFGSTRPPPKKGKVETLPPDTDGDGIAMNDDWCPGEAEDKDGFHDDDGCPELDNDGDGLADEFDVCPLVAENVNQVEDEDGCPESDDDGDGILGAQDGCPDQTEDADGYEDEDGCPEPDNDSDGLADESDQCPNEAETANGFEDDDGCPDKMPRELRKLAGKLAGVTFAKGSHELTKRATTDIDGLADLLLRYPSVRITIAAYCGELGERLADLQLAALRAAAIKRYLVEKEVGAERVTAAGHTTDEPLPEGRKRRPRKSGWIELVLNMGTEGETDSTDSETAAPAEGGSAPSPAPPEGDATSGEAPPADAPAPAEAPADGETSPGDAPADGSAAPADSP